VARYLAGAPAEVESLTADDLAADRIWLGLRTSDGVDCEAFSGRPELARELCASGLAVERDGRIQPTLPGFLAADRVARRVVAG
jgi:coproporphyrinogen III oxidase-like Fe-S oxidoreductase